MIWVDTDIALGTPSGDVDDGFALAAIAVGRGVAGVSCVSGNTDGSSARDAAARLLERCDLEDVRIVDEEGAPAAIARLPEGTSVVAIGPPTNLVKAIDLDPSLPARIDVRVVGTVIDRVRSPILPYFCLNFRRDPAATARFFASRWRSLTVFPLDVVRRLTVDRARLAVLGARGPVGAYLEAGSIRWLRRAPLRYGAPRFPVWDLVAALDALDALPGAAFVHEGGRRVLHSFDERRAWDVFLEILSGGI
jgi:inosine-uridine nucleoside N-ribohydrolase